MAQQLILPINNTKVTASWKTTAYMAKFGFVHYGADLISTIYNRTLYASGTGTVVACGNDSVLGNVVAVLYPDAQNRVTGKVRGVVLRYFHLARIAVKNGQKVTKDTVLGEYCNTGLYSTAAHLHIEADTDTAHPLYSPTVLSSSLLRGRSRGATDTTMTNPIEWLYCKASGPDKQTYTTAGDQFIRAEDKTILIIQ